MVGNRLSESWRLINKSQVIDVDNTYMSWQGPAKYSSVLYFVVLEQHLHDGTYFVHQQDDQAESQLQTPKSSSSHRRHFLHSQTGRSHHKTQNARRFHYFFMTFFTIRPCNDWNFGTVETGFQTEKTYTYRNEVVKISLAGVVKRS